MNACVISLILIAVVAVLLLLNQPKWVRSVKSPYTRDEEGYEEQYYHNEYDTGVAQPMMMVPAGSQPMMMVPAGTAMAPAGTQPMMMAPAPTPLSPAKSSYESESFSCCGM